MTVMMKPPADQSPSSRPTRTPAGHALAPSGGGGVKGPKSKVQSPKSAAADGCGPSSDIRPSGGPPSASEHSPLDALATVEGVLAHLEQLEEQLQQVREGLTHSHRLATLGTIASIIAHEYNNILTPMVSYAQLALAKPDDAALMKKAVEKSLAGAERAAHISASLLGFAREADEQHAAPLRKTIDDAVACLARDPRKDGIDLTIDVPDVRVAIAPLNLEQVLVNLMLNAKQAMRRAPGSGGGGIRGSLRITATVRADLVELCVADNGPGIPPAILDRLFEPFVTMRAGEEVQGPESSVQSQSGGAGDEGADVSGGNDSPKSQVQSPKSEARKGTGLGLSICRDLVRQAGGNINVDSTPGKGATFHITLPKADDLLDAA
jgi:signal transduction histidine kinase